MDIHEMRMSLGDTQSDFAARYNIPFRTIQNWESGVRKPPDYVISLLQSRYQSDIVNRKTISLPKHDAKKKNLPKRSEYVGSISWLKAVNECLGGGFVFALDESLMCQGYFGGRSDEYLVWGYGAEETTEYNGVVLLGNRVSRYDIEEKNGLLYTSFNRTLADSIANETILDMQGITEALSKYYYTNGENFDGIFVAPENRRKFEYLVQQAMEYYITEYDVEFDEEELEL